MAGDGAEAWNNEFSARILCIGCCTAADKAELMPPPCMKAVPPVAAPGVGNPAGCHRTAVHLLHFAWRHSTKDCVFDLLILGNHTRTCILDPRN